MTDNATPSRILVVDDEPKICQFLEVLLQREGHSVASVANAADALRRVEAEPYDLVISDLKMPGMDGFELVKWLKNARADLPIIMVTGYATVENAVKALRFGVDDYVTKPFDIEELRRVVSRTLATARLERENRDLVDRLHRVNSELERHRRLLAKKVQKTGSELVSTRDVLKEHQGRLSVLNQLSELVAREHDIQRLLSGVLTAVNRQFGARYSSVMLREGDNLVIRAAEGERGKHHLGRRQPLGQGIAGIVATQAQPLLVRDLARDDRLPRGAERSYRTNSFLCAPISQHQRLLGVVSVGDKSNGQSFDQPDLDLLVSIANQIAPAIENALLYRALEVRCAEVIQALAATLEAKDNYTSGHSNRVGAYAGALARAADTSEADIEILQQAAQLHDIGKIGISDLILSKPAKLDNDELELIWTHPAVGERIIRSLDFLGPVRPLVRHHHERVDGRGYPDGLHGDEIPRLARMLAIADAYDAMTTARPYRPAMAMEEAAGELRGCADTQFDADLAEIFCRSVAPEAARWAETSSGEQPAP